MTRIKYVNDRLDQVVLHKPRFVHLEELERDTWALTLSDQEGDRLHLTINGEVKITYIEEAL